MPIKGIFVYTAYLAICLIPLLINSTQNIDYKPLLSQSFCPILSKILSTSFPVLLFFGFYDIKVCQIT